MGYFYSVPEICSLFASGTAFLSLGTIYRDNHDLSNTNNKKKAKIATNLGVGSKYMLLSISFCQNIMCMFVKKIK